MQFFVTIFAAAQKWGSFTILAPFTTPATIQKITILSPQSGFLSREAINQKPFSAQFGGVDNGKLKSIEWRMISVSHVIVLLTDQLDFVIGLANVLVITIMLA